MTPVNEMLLSAVSVRYVERHDPREGKGGAWLGLHAEAPAACGHRAARRSPLPVAPSGP